MAERLGSASEQLYVASGATADTRAVSVSKRYAKGFYALAAGTITTTQSRPAADGSSVTAGPFAVTAGMYVGVEIAAVTQASAAYLLVWE